VHARSDDKDDDIKDSVYRELEQAFDQFLSYHMKIFPGYFNAEVGREDILKPIIGNETLYEVNNNNGATEVNFATSKNVSRVHYHTATFIKTLGLLLIVSHINI
jgi:hypothetical protein